MTDYSLDHVHFTVDLGDDGFPCPICPREEMPPPVYYPPVAEMPGRTRIDDLQWGFDRMAHDRHFQQLQAEVAAGTLVPEPVDPWRIEDPPEAEDLWRQIVALGMRLVEMRREPNGPGSGPTALVAAQVAPPLPQSRALAPQAMGPGVQAMAPLMPQGHPAHAHGPARRRSSNNSTLNPVTAFRGEFVPGQTWAANRLSRRQAARARAEWSLAHYQHGPWQIQSPLSQSMAPSQAPPAPIQTRGLLTRPAHQLTRMQQVITADDLEIAAGGADASGEAMAVGESGKGRRSTVVPEPGVGEVREGEDLYGVSD